MVAMNQVTFAYGKQRPLFDSLDLRLPDGNIYGLLGKNGAGKTTLLKIFAGLLFPREGSSMLNCCEAGERNPRALEELFFLPEEFSVPATSGKRFVRLFAPFYPHFDYEAMHEYTGELGLDLSRPLPSLSYGMKKKFSLAFGLASGCRTLLLDEPTNGLDIPSKSIFRKLVASALTEERSFVISTHQVRDLENLIDPVVILDEGNVLFYRSIEEITRALEFGLSSDEPEEALYSEKVPGGYAVVRPNRNATDSRVDLELLFNAVTQQSSRLNSCFTAQEARK
ncbi:MAG: ABC transporter ATP-binding protein [Spirochaetales bacterium]|nr:ABC transporter ATP-binding protein [Spirochaetales bacterium]MCF7937390.1 ABC transporter ATP-binding protein [Spirochaetales bacterium]